MPKLMDKIKTALDADFKAKMSAAQAAIKRENELTALQTHMRAQLAEIEMKRDRAALPEDMGGNDKLYAQLDKETKELEVKLDKNLRAIREAGRLKVEAEAELRKSGAANEIKMAKEYGAELTAAVAEITAGIERAVKGWKALHDYAERVGLWHGELNINAGGLMLRKNEIRQNVEAEIYRQSAPAVLDNQGVPVFPGGVAAFITGNKKDTLAELAERAAAYLERRVEKLIADAVNKPATVTEPNPQTKPEAKPQRDPDGLDDQPIQANGPRFNAAQVQGGLGRVRMS